MQIVKPRGATPAWRAAHHHGNQLIESIGSLTKPRQLRIAAAARQSPKPILCFDEVIEPLPHVFLGHDGGGFCRDR
ncbi:hypothetical protein ACFU8W_50420 [Streptomyces sp. NPDC057565]|uniref:hypothetical protein n=1 Tax=Streptomyces sp. NPDC057565 TaxID=3346169 RepID=UPI003698BBA2